MIVGMRHQKVWPVPTACILGFALLLAYTNMQSIVGSRLAGVLDPTLSVILYRGAETATYLAVALASRRLRAVASHPLAVWAVAAVCAVAMAIRIVPGEAVLPAVASRLLRGVGEAALWTAWIEQYARMDLRRVLTGYLAASIVASVATLALSPEALDGVAIAMTALLPLASAPLLVRTSRRLDSAAFTREETASTVPGLPVVPIVLMAVFTFANVFARNTLPAGDRIYATIGALACLAALLAALHFGKPGFGVWPLCGISFPLALAGLFGLLLDGREWGIAATLCTNGGEALFSAFIAAVLCNISFRYGVSALALFGYTKAAGSLTSLGGGALAESVSGMGANGHVLAVACTALALAACYVALTRNPGVEITWGVGRGGDAEIPPSTDALRERLLARCSQVAYEFGLTRREEQVLTLLAQNKSAAEIEEELCVSNSTVKSHTNAVYKKLGLHSRAEVAAFMDEREGSGV